MALKNPYLTFRADGTPVPEYNGGSRMPACERKWGCKTNGLFVVAGAWTTRPLGHVF
jgi:hypothetical protein